MAKKPTAKKANPYGGTYATVSVKKPKGKSKKK